MSSLKAKDLCFFPRMLNPGIIKTPNGIFWWLVAGHVFQPPEKKDLQSDTWWLGGYWLGGWVAGGWMMVAGLPGGWWLVAATPLHRTNHQPPPTSHRWSCG